MEYSSNVKPGRPDSRIQIFLLFIKMSILFSFFCSDVSLTEDQYALYGHKTGRIPRSANQMYDPTR